MTHIVCVFSPFPAPLNLLVTSSHSRSFLSISFFSCFYSYCFFYRSFYFLAFVIRFYFSRSLSSFPYILLSFIASFCFLPFPDLSCTSSSFCPSSSNILPFLEPASHLVTFLAFIYSLLTLHLFLSSVLTLPSTGPIIRRPPPPRPPPHFSSLSQGSPILILQHPHFFAECLV